MPCGSRRNPAAFQCIAFSHLCSLLTFLSSFPNAGLPDLVIQRGQCCLLGKPPYTVRQQSPFGSKRQHTQYRQLHPAYAFFHRGCNRRVASSLPRVVLLQPSTTGRPGHAFRPKTYGAAFWNHSHEEPRWHYLSDSIPSLPASSLPERVQVGAFHAAHFFGKILYSTAREASFCSSMLSTFVVTASLDNFILFAVVIGGTNLLSHRYMLDKALAVNESMCEI